MESSTFPYIRLLITFLLAASLQLAPLPLNDFKPDFLALFILFWSLNQTHISLGTAWLVGLMADILLLGLLGQHALGFLLLNFLAQRIQRQFHLLSILQQVILVFVILAFYSLLLVAINGITAQAAADHLYGWALLSSTLIWPVLWLLFRDKNQY